MQQIQFIGISPDEFLKSIDNSRKSALEALKKEFQPKEPTEYLTRQEVADLLKVDISTVHNWTKRGKLKKYGIGHRTYYKRLEVESALKPINQEQ